MNITETKWRRDLEVLSTRLKRELLVACIRTTGGSEAIEVSFGRFICAVELRGARNEHGRHWVPVARLGSSTLPPDPLAAWVVLRGVTEVVEAGLQLVAELGEYRVWEDGSCPCDVCGSTGKLPRGAACTTCSGVGVL